MTAREWLGKLRWSTVKREVGGRFADMRRRAWQRRHLDPATPKRPVFVVGLQRSGTNMVMWTLERSPHVWVYHEHVWNAAFRNFRLRPNETIQRLIDRSSAPVVAFKPVCEHHLTDRLLGRHPNSRAVWIYRNYRDVANSALRNFGEHQRDVMGWIARGDHDLLGWRGERLNAEMVALARRLYREDLRVEEAGAYIWYIRNLFFFEMGLDRDERVRLVRYEDLVGGNEQPFRELFEFVGVPFDPAYLKGVFGSSVGKNPFPDISEEMRALCEDLTRRLDVVHARRDSRRTLAAVQPD